MRIASWNVNSVRARLDHVETWLRETQPDVLCLQETKVIDDEFPLDTFSRQGYEIARVGQRTYNGVALISRHPIEDVSIGHHDHKEEDAARLIAGTIQGVRVLSAYVPNGKNLDSPSYPEKLDWLARLKKTLELSCAPRDKIALCGDFNIARDDRDVFDADLMRDKIHFSPPEHEAFDALLSFGLKDTFRLKEEAGDLFSWWDYRMGAFRRNRGLRIDYIFASEPIVEKLETATIDTVPRKWEKPSDHAPVVIEFKND